MTEDHPYDKYREQITPAIISKVEEFILLGYDRTSEDQVWACLKKKVWKKKKDDIRIHQLVSDVMKLPVQTYMSYLTVQSYSDPTFFFADKE